MMKKKNISFSGFIVIQKNQFVNQFDFQQQIPVKTYINKEGDKRYFFDVNYINTFMTITLNHGRPFPYKEFVYNIDTEIEEKNPRTNNQIESKIDFCLIDFSKSYLWLSNSNNKRVYMDFIMTSFKDYSLILKDVYNEDEFLSSIKSLNELKFSDEPDIFNDNDLSASMIENIYGYGAEKLSLNFKYNSEEAITERVLGKIKNLFNNRNSFRNLVVSGKDEKNLGILFNSTNFSRKIEFSGEVDEGEVFKSDKIFEKLIESILKEDK
jgi:hypothetical protein